MLKTSYTRPCSKSNYVIHDILSLEEAEMHAHAVGQLLYAENEVLYIEYLEKKVLLPAQYCSWIPPFKLHRIWSMSSSCQVKGIYFESEFCKNKIFSESSVFRLSVIMREMIKYTARWNNALETSEYENTFIKCIRQMLPEEIASAITLEIPVTTHELLGKILSYISENLHAEIRIEKLVAMNGISSKTLQRLFIKELGQSFTHYLIVLRVIRAIELLDLGTLTIKEVAYEVGYNSIPSFNKIFKQVAGSNPNVFLNKKIKHTIG